MDIRRVAGRTLPVLVLLATLVLFIVIIALQSRWIGQLSDAELGRARVGLGVSVKGIQSNINRELTRAYLLFQWEAGAPPQAWGERTAEAYAIWRHTAEFPDLVRRLLVAHAAPDGGDLRLAAYNRDTRQYDPIPWPGQFNTLRRQLALPFKSFDTFGVRMYTGVAVADVPVLVFPLIPAITKAYPDATGWGVIELDQELLLTHILPQAIRDNVEQPDQFDYQVSRDGFPDKVIYKSNPGVEFSSADASCSLLEIGRQYLLTDKSGTGQGGRFPIGQSPDERQALSRPYRLHAQHVNLPGVPPAPISEGGVWQLQIRHHAGSLAAATERMRRNNLLLAFAMMALVAADLAALTLAARRAHRLGQVRLQLAAGVSHELRTPLAAICSAADNLAAGVAHEPAKVRQYGAAILGQGKQLAEMVEQILSYTGGQLGKRNYEIEVLDPADVVKEAIAAVAPSARAAGIAIEEQIPPDLPQVPGDSQALRQALVNLLANAIKYGAAGRWIGVSARHARDELEISVADRGPGIPAAEMKRIFEPFYRGSTSADPALRGSGLGLTIVDQIARAHGGKTTVASTCGRGSCFTLHLRIA